MFIWPKTLVVAASLLFLASCAALENTPSATRKSTDSNIETKSTSSLANVLAPGSTWVAYELKSQGNSLVPSFCAAAPGVDFRGPIAGAQDGVCVFGDGTSSGLLRRDTLEQNLRGFNPPGGRGRQTPGASTQVVDDSGRIFQFYQVLPGLYFPALLGFQNRVLVVDGQTPYYRVVQGRINYIASYNVPLGADPAWEPQALADALLAKEPSFELNRINSNKPQKARIECQTNTSLLQVGPRRCTMNVLEGNFF